MKEIEIKAKTVHEAIEEACEKLGVPQENLSIEILSQGGMFGKAKILATVKEEPAIETKPAAPIEKKSVEKDTAKKPVVSSKKTRNGEDCPSKEPQRSGSGDAKRHASSADVSVAADDTTGTRPRKFDACLTFVTKLLELLHNDSKITTAQDDRAFNINVNGENIGILIGKNGMVLNALQTLVSSVAISNSNGEGKRVFINVGDYKERRGDTLQSIAMKKAEHVKKSGRYVKLDPMNARDRAIIHTILASVEGIKTYSTGRDPFRCLCIAPADKEEKKEEN